jgi:Bacterial cadherin-like domain
LPANTFLASNYFDVVFNPGGGGGSPEPPVANNDSGFVTTQNTPLLIQAATLLANDTDPGGLAISLNTVSNGSGGTVSSSGSTDGQRHFLR